MTIKDKAKGELGINIRESVNEFAQSNKDGNNPAGYFQIPLEAGRGLSRLEGISSPAVGGGFFD